VNPDTTGYMWRGEFDLNTLSVVGEIFESGKEKCRFKNIRIRVDGALANHLTARRFLSGINYLSVGLRPGLRTMWNL